MGERGEDRAEQSQVFFLDGPQELCMPLRKANERCDLWIKTSSARQSTS